MDKSLFTHLFFFLLLLNFCEPQSLPDLLNPLNGCFSNILTYQIFRVNFYFSSQNQTNQLLTDENLNSDTIDFDPRRRTVFIIHGLTPNFYLDKSFNLRDAFLNWKDINVIYVDWGEGCPSTLLYLNAVHNTEYVAIKLKELFGQFINTWKGTEKSVENWGPLHFIGLSLGAHIAGQTAALLQQEYNISIDRITGLDPAGPCFNDPHSRLRLKKSDARFVDIIHTDAARTENRRLGLFDPIGHVDFYVNGGSVQPGCELFRTKRLADLLWLGYHLTIENGICHHLRSIELFTESLKQAVNSQCTFWAYPSDIKTILISTEPPNGIDSCNKQRCVEMGINADLYNNVSDVYYVATSGASPYC